MVSVWVLLLCSFFFLLLLRIRIPTLAHFPLDDAPLKFLIVRTRFATIIRQGVHVNSGAAVAAGVARHIEVNGTDVAHACEDGGLVYELTDGLNVDERSRVAH